MPDDETVRTTDRVGADSTSVGGAGLDVSRVLAAQWLELGNTLRQADLKAQVLLGIDAILLTGLVSLDGNGGTALRGVGVLGGLAVAALVGSIVFALLTILPRRGASETDEDVLLYYGGMARLSERAFIDRYLDLTLGDLKRLILADLHALAVVAARKFQGVRVSVILLGAAVLLWVIGRVAS